jgi:predicted NBD/HSP70 family sugar kinase/biotin operon repressor
MEVQRGTFQWMKSLNKSIILNKIRTNAPISRAEIAKETKLTPPTVSNIVKELLEQGIVVESDSGESKGGRRPTMLLINNDAFYVIGVDAGPQTMECVLADLSGKVIERHAQPIHVPTSNARFLAVLKESIQQVIQSVPDRSEKIIGIGVAMHGVVDVSSGTSLYAPNLDLSNVPIKAELEEAFDMVVQVENDARAMALGESWFGGHGQLDSMVAVNLGRGVGAGVVMDGALYHGAQDLAGELGHMTIDIHGNICECGNRGCLQTFASGDAIGARAVKLLAGEELLTGEEVYQRAQAGEAQCIRALKETGIYIGVGLMNLIHVINPEKIVLGGGVMKSEAFLMPGIRQTVEERVLTPEAKKVKVEVTKLGDDATLLGAVALLLSELFKPK